MGQKSGKHSDGNNGGNNGGNKEEGNLIVVDNLESMLQNDDVKMRLKNAAKAKGANVSNALLAFEAIGKRRNVYTSGKRCGDGEEALEEKMRNLGHAILEKHLSDDADAPIHFDEDCETIRQNIERLDAFDDLSKKLEQFVKQSLA